MNTLKAEKRSLDVKAKKLRREGYVTGNVFGREIEKSIPVKMTKKDVDRILKTENKGSQVALEIDGKTYNALIKEIVYNSMAGRVDEIDFQALVSNEKVNSVAEVIPLNYDRIQEGILQVKLNEISYRALPEALVDKIKIDVGEMKVGDVIQVKDLSIASDERIELLTNPETVVVTVTAVHNAAPETEDSEETAE